MNEHIDNFIMDLMYIVKSNKLDEKKIVDIIDLIIKDRQSIVTTAMWILKAFSSIEIKRIKDNNLLN